ncbi:MAG: DUF547 domain-containing protein [Acidobacteriota bacterium]|nr:DUF547 domain-containing protein [Acidobacteriota bacterium]
MVPLRLQPLCEPWPRSRRRGVLVLLALFGLVFGSRSLPAWGEPEQRFSHEAWGEVLEAFVDDQGLVDYAGLRDSDDRLRAYLEQIHQRGPANAPHLFPDRDHQLAYYINAYNALVFEGVLSKGPGLKSVWGWTGTGFGFFFAMDVEVEGRTTNLKNFEDDVIREGFQDPRIHAALNCASRGCPRLPRQPFLGAELDQQLDTAMTEFVTDPRHVRVDVKARTVAFSQIFDWFREDFLSYERGQGSEEPNLLTYVNRYRPDGQKIPADFRVEFLDYDKSLNAQR